MIEAIMYDLDEIVRINPDLSTNKYYVNACTLSMTYHAGDKAKILEYTHDNGYYLDIDNKKHNWSHDMLQPLTIKDEIMDKIENKTEHTSDQKVVDNKSKSMLGNSSLVDNLILSQLKSVLQKALSIVDLLIDRNSKK